MGVRTGGGCRCEAGSSGGRTTVTSRQPMKLIFFMREKRHVRRISRAPVALGTRRGRRRRRDARWEEASRRRRGGARGAPVWGQARQNERVVRRNFPRIAGGRIARRRRCRGRTARRQAGGWMRAAAGALARRSLYPRRARRRLLQGNKTEVESMCAGGRGSSSPARDRAPGRARRRRPAWPRTVRRGTGAWWRRSGRCVEVGGGGGGERPCARTCN